MSGQVTSEECGASITLVYIAHWFHVLWHSKAPKPIRDILFLSWQQQLRK